MSVNMIKKGLYSVGVLNPNLRVFDIVMRTDFGTSYNSFIIKDEKTALIETCHQTFWDEYLQNIQEVTPLEDIDYIILSHTEPDHSGVLDKLLKKCPNAKIICTKAASIYLKKITNDENFTAKVVTNGETLSLGNLELKFISAPLLHWPDTMFTYIEKLATVVTCDFLGAHYCEPRMIDTYVTYQGKYELAQKEYFDAIMSPFKPYVLAGLEKLKALNFDTALVSHGPVLTQNGQLEKIMQSYEKWSKAEQSNVINIPIFYCSAYGYTKELAKTAQQVILKKYPEVNCKTYNIIDYDLADLAKLLNSSNAFMIGSPTINKDAVAPIWSLLSLVDAINNQKKPVGVFGSFGWSGEAVSSIIARLNSLRIKVIGEGCKCVFAPSESDLDSLTEYTNQFLNELQL
ncbi:MAG TPA: FprA family A-type flavoprotein [Clostridia bacterium]|nr:FprA family A-type flavoprotein [Clostridia bacterium]